MATIKSLPYEVCFEFIPFIDANLEYKGNYDSLIYQVYLQNFDAVVGDITITSNRSLYVDFTLPYTDLGVGTIARISNKDMWFFLQPLEANLWLISAGFFILTGFVIWVIEHPINEEFQGSRAQQIGTVFWFSFLTLVYAHRQKLLSNLSRFVATVWVFVVLVMTSNYTATLSSLLTVQQFQLASKGSIGYRAGSLVQGVAFSNLNFRDNSFKAYPSIETYVKALSLGSKHGGVDAITDEITYVKLFLAKYSGQYALIASQPSTSGFGFAFQKGSPLVPELSREIAKLREDGKLMMMEKQWFTSQSSLVNQVLKVDSFGGLLFLISAVSSGSVLLLFHSSFLC